MKGTRMRESRKKKKKDTKQPAEIKAPQKSVAVCKYLKIV